ncbi:hypothetical protein ACLQ24_16630 [Micromonospora sp. DT4]|uniref:hypothetical protein n=1 Tax=Micromonospora sp. DT4 TaxID=3393438 RepID=UPI003CF45B7F
MAHRVRRVSLDLPGRALLVHRVPTRGLDQAVRALVPAVAVRFVDAAHSEATISEWLERVRADFDYWACRGIPLHSTGPKIGECVTVGIDHPQRDAGKLHARYPLLGSFSLASMATSTGPRS